MNENIIKRASEIIFSNEGGYASVNADDNGAVSVGRLQWHGTRALNLLKKIVDALGQEEAISHLGEMFFKEICTAASWSNRIVDIPETDCLISILGTNESHEVQDNQANEDVSAYLVHVANLGVEEENAQIFMADIENQGGGGASARIIQNSTGYDIDSLYVSASVDVVFRNYMSRRDRVYTKLMGHRYGEEAYNGIVYEVKYGDTLSGIGAQFEVDWRDIAEINGITNPNHIRTGDFLKIPSTDVIDTPEANEEIPQNEHSFYSVKCGDTLSKIGAEYGIDWREIAYINHIYAPYTIYIGQVLLIPIAKIEKPVEIKNITYTVQRGDTLSAIAKEYNVSVDDIVKANSIANKNMIYVGQTLIIPQ